MSELDEDDSDFEWRTRGEFTVEGKNLTRVPPDPDIGRFDICVAQVIDVTRHPDNYNTMYIQTLDTGRYTRKRKTASMLVKDYKPAQLLGRLVLAVLNVRPMFNRELVKRFLLMCAQNRNTGRFELLDPPPGSMAGDSVGVEGFPHRPIFEFCLGKYEKKSIRHYFLPYKKHRDSYHFEEFDETKPLFDATAAELWVNEDRVAEFMGVPLRVEGRGVVTTKTLSDCPIVFE